MISIRKLLILITLSGTSGLWATSRAQAPISPDRERFLALLLSRQDQAIERALVRRDVQLTRQVERLGHVVPGSPQQARQLARREQQLVQREQVVSRLITQPPESPLRRRLDARDRRLLLLEQQLERRLKQLRRLVPGNPQQARQLARLERQLEQQERQLKAQSQQIERELATPFAPGNPIK